MTVYFISDGSGAIKIGYTDTDVCDRLRILQTGNVRELTLLGTIEGGPELEKELHARFGSQRIRGEWFASTLELLKLIPEQPKKEYVFEFPEPSEDGLPIGLMVREWRRNKGWTQQELAQEIGITQETLSNFEKGKRNLGLENAIKLRSVVGDWFKVDSALSQVRAAAVRALASSFGES